MKKNSAVSESAADTAAAKTLQGHYVRSNDSYQSGGIFKVASVNDDGSATLHGPIGKGGMKTVSHGDLVRAHTDLGDAEGLAACQESGTEEFEPSGHAVKMKMASVSQLEEAAYDASKGLLTLTVIKPGFNKSGERYYPAAMLKRDYKIFEGAKMFADHQTEAEAKHRPENSINNWVGSLKKVWAESDGTIKGQAAVIDPALKSKLEELNKQGLLGDMGVSIRAFGEASAQQVQGRKTNLVESLVRARSVDFVTYAGAGGQVEAIEAERDREEEEFEWDGVTESELRSRRPDLVQLIESTAKENIMNATEEKALRDELAGANAKLAEATKKVEESEKATKKAAAQTELAKLLKESKLPEISQKRLEKQFAEATVVDGIKEAVEEEQKYVRSLGAKPGVVKHMGERDNKQATEQVSESERFEKRKKIHMAQGMPEKQAEIAARGR